MEVIDPSIDPVIDFLVNRRQGHCAYFASALALLLRSIEIPVAHGQRLPRRRLERAYRRGHAFAKIHGPHGWVEALVGQATEGDNEPVPLWMTFRTPRQ